MLFRGFNRDVTAFLCRGFLGLKPRDSYLSSNRASEQNGKGDSHFASQRVSLLFSQLCGPCACAATRHCLRKGRGRDFLSLGGSEYPEAARVQCCREGEDGRGAGGPFFLGRERCGGGGAAGAGRRRLLGPEALGPAAEGPGGHPLHQSPHRSGPDPGPGRRHHGPGGAAGGSAARHGGGHSDHLRGDRGPLWAGGQAHRGGSDRRQGLAKDGAQAPAGRTRRRQQPGRQAGQAGRQALQPAGPEPLHPQRLV